MTDSAPHDVVPPLPGGWPSDWLRAVLGMAALRSLEPGPSYGYAIIRDLAAAGLGQVKGGTLYPLLTRLERAGLIDTEWRPGEAGPGRKYFALTDLGRTFLRDQKLDWSRFSALVAHHLNTDQESPS